MNEFEKLRHNIREQCRLYKFVLEYYDNNQPPEEFPRPVWERWRKAIAWKLDELQAYLFWLENYDPTQNESKIITIN